MAAEISDRVREIADARGVREGEVFEQALELRIADLWENVVLGKYVDGELSREEAIELVGLENVQRADREAAAVEADVDWGLNA
ncbi:hypothetical protein A4G99_16580 [Haladaptatus sp. R4]|uniref:hypothetical protein n=1 Tax=Haladaptatus sp. R4 TaxID=1679489 RepID=UPI0007B4F642|nr:hypothetical protein [Haladaptatus sp. R4]KZN23113.1 hypothetical protein A4G99_16580 [Haladaptatus sp. R4]